MAKKPIEAIKWNTKKYQMKQIHPYFYLKCELTEYYKSDFSDQIKMQDCIKNYYKRCTLNVKIQGKCERKEKDIVHKY